MYTHKLSLVLEKLILFKTEKVYDFEKELLIVVQRLRGQSFVTHLLTKKQLPSSIIRPKARTSWVFFFVVFIDCPFFF